ncbi:unnamed protein product [Pleuronectes platessa]|uniref:PX domain-containing protein n=1 Tax=Pleuronectes platessa TaxID=8262 RepID=A0A9N7Y6Z8_PLEPL|nr:unnamed protein product [Pleuronectes platessa]
MEETGAGAEPEPGSGAEPEPGQGAELRRNPTHTDALASGCPSLTTQQLQENVRVVKRRHRPERLMFEIPSARIIDQVLSKHVVYQVVLMRSGRFDSRRVSVERRYSDFSRLHHALQREFRDELEDLVLPPKLLSRNFCPHVIAERRVALQDYMSEVSRVRCVSRCGLFPAFFTEQEQRRGHALLRAGQFEAARQQLQEVLVMEEKLLPWQSATLLVPTLSALAVCHRDLEEPEHAHDAALRALPAVRRYGLKRHRAALLSLLVDVGYELGRPVAQFQEELSRLRDAERGGVSSCSLKELVVQEFI